MTQTPPRANETSAAPDEIRAALAELMEIGLSVARMIGRLAEAETALALSAAGAGAEDGASALATSLAEAIEADRAAAAAAEARHTVVARMEVIAGGFARVARCVRLTVMLSERLERGWARPVVDDRQAMGRRQIARGVEDAIAREAEGERAERLTEALADRLESLDVERELADRPVEEVIRVICRGLGLDPMRDLVGHRARLGESEVKPGEDGLGMDGPGKDGRVWPAPVVERAVERVAKAVARQEMRTGAVERRPDG